MYKVFWLAHHTVHPAQLILLCTLLASQQLAPIVLEIEPTPTLPPASIQHSAQFNFTPLHWFSEGFLITFSQHIYDMFLQKTFGCSYTSSVFVREWVKKLPSLKPQCYHNHRILNSALSSVGLLLIAEAMPVGGLPVILLLSPWLGITFSLLIQPIAAQMAKNVLMGFKTALLWTHPPPEAWTVQVWGSSDVARISQILFGPLLGGALNDTYSM